MACLTIPFRGKRSENLFLTFLNPPLRDSPSRDHGGEYAEKTRNSGISRSQRLEKTELIIGSTERSALVHHAVMECF